MTGSKVPSVRLNTHAIESHVTATYYYACAKNSDIARFEIFGGRDTNTTDRI